MSLAIRSQPLQCELCKRAGQKLTVHHLIPKSKHRKKAVQKLFDKQERLTRVLWVCRPCHSMIHLAASELKLALIYNCKERLIELPMIQEYLQWIKDKPESYMPRVRKACKRRR